MKQNENGKWNKNVLEKNIRELFYGFIMGKISLSIPQNIKTFNREEFNPINV